MYITSPNPTNQFPHPHLQCYTHPWQMAPTHPSASSKPTVIQGMTSVSPNTDKSPSLTIIPGTPDQPLAGPSDQHPQTTTTDRELLALYNLFPPIIIPETQPIHEITYAEMVRREYLWTRICKRLKKNKNKRQPPSPILSPITMASPLLTVSEPKSSPSPSYTDLDSESSLDIYFRVCQPSPRNGGV